MTAPQAALDLPPIEELFPRWHKTFGDFCLAKIRAMLASPAPTAAYEWDKGFTAADRAWLCGLAKVDAIAAWSKISAADRARLLAAFERLKAWCETHDQFSVGADPEQYVEHMKKFFLK